MSLRAGIEIDLTGYSGKAPEVLILYITAVAPAHYLHGYQVLLAKLDIIGDIKLGLHLAVLAVAHILSVHPNPEV